MVDDSRTRRSVKSGRDTDLVEILCLFAGEAALRVRRSPLLHKATRCSAACRKGREGVSRTCSFETQTALSSTGQSLAEAFSVAEVVTLKTLTSIVTSSEQGAGRTSTWIEEAMGRRVLIGDDEELLRV